MGLSQVFVLSLELQKFNWKSLLMDDMHATCLAQRAVGEAPWGSFDLICVCVGSIFVIFSFYRQSDIHSVRKSSHKTDSFFLFLLSSSSRFIWVICRKILLHLVQCNLLGTM